MHTASDANASAEIKDRAETDTTLSVNVNVEFITTQTSRIEASIQGLGERLKGVLREASPKVEKDKKTEGEPCGLSVKLNDLGNRLVEVAERIEDISNRLEL